MPERVPDNGQSQLSGPNSSETPPAGSGLGSPLPSHSRAGLPYIVEPMRLDDLDQVMEIEKVAFPAPWSARAYRYEITQNEYGTLVVVRSAQRSSRQLSFQRARGSGGVCERQSRPRTPPPPFFEKIRRQLPEWLSWLGQDGRGPVLGYAGFWLLVDEAHIATIAVHPDWRGQGLGELLLVALLEEGLCQEARHATLEVRIHNQVAQGLYRKYGFETTGVRKCYYTDNKEDALIMTTPPFDTPGFQSNLIQCRTRLYGRIRKQGLGPQARSGADQLDKNDQMR